VAGGPEGLAGNHSHLGLVEDEVGELQRGRRRHPAPGAPEQALDIGIDVEGSERVGHDEPIDRGELGDDEAATAVEGLAHLLRLGLGTGERGDRGLLRHVVHVAGEMRLEVPGDLDRVGRADHPAHPPSGHRIGLRDAVDEDRLPRGCGDRLDDRHGLDALVGEVLVDLVRDDPDAVLDRPFADRPGLLGCV
ncbi:hypothetical protein ABE10_01780, partial [Bacillus toyonensis]|nr:hypothetical protein [Bacillus toyonensis]